MTIEQVEKEYDRISEAVFGKAAHWAATSFLVSSRRFSRAELQKQIQRVVKEHSASGDPNGKMLDVGNPCKVLVKLVPPVTACGKETVD